MEKTTKRYFLLGNYYAFIVTGLIVLMTGPILPYLMKEFGLSYDKGGMLLSLQAVGNLLAGIVSGITSDFMGRKLTLVFGAAFFVIGFGGLLFSSTVYLLFVFIFISGLGWGIMNNVVNGAVSDATGGNSSIMNLLHTFFAIGAFSSPFLVGLFISLGMGWRAAVVLVTILSIILVIVFSFMEIDNGNKITKENKLSFKFLTEVRFFIFMGILFFYVGTEGSINGWMVTYLINTGLMSKGGAANILSMMWIVMIGGRLACAYVSNRVSSEKILLVSGIGSAVFLILFLTSANPVLLIFCIIAIGISLSGIYPTTVANASYLFKGSGIAAGIMLSCGGLGASVVPLAVGVWAEVKGIYVGMSIIVLSASILAVLGILNFIKRKSSSSAGN